MDKKVTKKAAKLQTEIKSIKLIEFIERSKRKEFCKEVNEHTDKEVKIFSRSEGRPNYLRILGVTEYELNKASQVHKIFDSIYLHVMRRTYALITIYISAKIDSSRFLKVREKQEDTQDNHLNIAHAGKAVLENAEKSLTSYLEEVTQSGFFSANKGNWKISSKINPSVWSFDITKEFSRYKNGDKSEFLEDKKELFGYLGCAKDQIKYPELETLGLDQLSATYYDNTSAAIKSHKFCSNDLGNFRLRTILLRLESHKSDKAKDSYFSSRGTSALAKAYNWLFWSLHTYFQTENHSIEVNNNKAYDNSQKLEELHEIKDDLKEEWFISDKHFDEIKKLVNRSPLLKKESLVNEELLETAEDIERYSKVVKDRILEKANDRIDKIKVTENISLNRKVYMLTIAILLYTLLSVFFDIWDVVGWQWSLLSPLVAILFAPVIYYFR